MTFGGMGVVHPYLCSLISQWLLIPPVFFWTNCGSCKWDTLCCGGSSPFSVVSSGRSWLERKNCASSLWLVECLRFDASPLLFRKWAFSVMTSTVWNSFPPVKGNASTLLRFWKFLKLGFGPMAGINIWGWGCRAVLNGCFQSRQFCFVCFQLFYLCIGLCKLPRVCWSGWIW